MHKKSIILLFVKAPVRGRVKSRLAASVGPDTALELYQNFILDIVATAGQTSLSFRLCYFPPDAGGRLSPLLGPSLNTMPQEGSDLGERMANAFARAFEEGHDRALLIGSDIPDLSAPLLADALESLDGHDAVLGPAEDGGYYLIGFNRNAFLPAVFRGIAWSTPTVFQETMERASVAGISVSRAPLRRDIDTLEDLKAFFERNDHGRFDKSKTMTYCKTNRSRLFP